MIEMKENGIMPRFAGVLVLALGFLLCLSVATTACIRWEPYNGIECGTLAPGAYVGVNSTVHCEVICEDIDKREDGLQPIHVYTYEEDTFTTYVWSAKSSTGVAVGAWENGQATTTVPTNTWIAPSTRMTGVTIECLVKDAAVMDPGDLNNRDDPDVTETLTVAVVDEAHYYSYDANGNLKTISGDCGMTTYTYDLKDRAVKVAESDGKFIEYQYDNNGNRTYMLDHFEGETTYEYYDRNLLKTITDRNDRETDYAYDSGGRLTRIDYPNVAYCLYTYTARNWTDTITHKKSGGAVIASFDYDYDGTYWGKNGTRTRVTEQILKTDNENYITARVDYQYDDLYHLTREHRYASGGSDAGVSYDKTYEYDAVGNRTEMVVWDSLNCTTTATTTYDYNSRNQMERAGSADYDYYPDGNMDTKTVGSVVTSYHWSVSNKLITVKVGANTIASYRYDGRGLRCEKTEGGTTTKFYYDNKNLLEEKEGVNMMAFYGTSEVYVDEAWRTLHSDGIGSTRAITSTSQAVTDACIYDAFGNDSLHDGSTSSAYTYAGVYRYYKSTAVGLYLLLTRSYDPVVGRFTSEDPAKDGPNWYAYADGNPVVYVDPSGLACIPISSCHITIIDHAGTWSHTLWNPIPTLRFPTPGPTFFGTAMYDHYDKGRRKWFCEDIYFVGCRPRITSWTVWRNCTRYRKTYVLVIGGLMDALLEREGTPAPTWP